MVAAVLPNPKGWDPTKPSGTLRSRHRSILQRERNAHFPERLLRAAVRQPDRVARILCVCENPRGLLWP